MYTTQQVKPSTCQNSMKSSQDITFVIYDILRKVTFIPGSILPMHNSELA